MNKKELKRVPLEKILHECALIKKAKPAHILVEFNWFVRECLWGRMKEQYKDRLSFIDDPNPETMRKIGLLFYEYCQDQYQR